MANDQRLIEKTAVEVIQLLQAGKITPIDLLDTLEARICDVDKQVNALPTLCFDRARDHSLRLMDKEKDEPSLLAGLPVPIKDLTPVAGVRYTNGSLLFEDNIAKSSDFLVERIEERGGVVYAKSNTSEFGAGGNTFNEVFGATLNPWDLTKSTAGSSGGAAASLASGTAWVAHGSDMGGSLRNPASFCGVVGLRPSPGRVPIGPKLLPYQNLGVQGPMARNVADTALFLDAMTGLTPLDPWSLPSPDQSFLAAAQSRQKPRRVAFSNDLGFMPVDEEVLEICRRAAREFEAIGIIVEEAHPKLEKSLETFWALRSNLFASAMGSMARQHPDKFKPELLDNIEVGFQLSAEDLIKSELARGEIYNAMAEFFQEYDLLLSPSTIVPPFPIEQRYVENCNGHSFSNYVDWLGIAFPATLASCPALSLPVGFTSARLPIGLQMIGRQKKEASLLSAAQIMEDQIGASPVPIDPRSGV